MCVLCMKYLNSLRDNKRYHSLVGYNCNLMPSEDTRIGERRERARPQNYWSNKVKSGVFTGK